MRIQKVALKCSLKKKLMNFQVQLSVVARFVLNNKKLLAIAVNIQNRHKVIMHPHTTLSHQLQLDSVFFCTSRVYAGTLNFCFKL